MPISLARRILKVSVDIRSLINQEQFVGKGEKRCLAQLHRPCEDDRIIVVVEQFLQKQTVVAVAAASTMDQQSTFLVSAESRIC